MRLLFFVFLCSFSFYSLAQLHHKTSVLQSFLSEDEKEQLETLTLPVLNNKVLLKNEKNRRKKQPKTAPKFAKTIPVHLNPSNAGVWIKKETYWVWTLQIESKGAESLNLGFRSFRLPKSAQMAIYGLYNTSENLGFLTAADNEKHQQLWTPLFFDDGLRIEVKVHQNEKEALLIELSSINHDFMGFGQASSSGSCNLDVICGGNDGWGIVDNYRDIIQSVTTFSLGGSNFCTGFLVNNTANDCKPYIMTAKHCGIDSSDAPSLVTYWNFQNSFCRQPDSPQSGQAGDGALNDFNTGAIFRSSYELTDMTLVELDDSVSQSANAFFPGWNRDIDPPTSSIAVHHPSTDEKRISFDNDPSIIVTDWNSTQNDTSGTLVKVLDWDVGTTEGGSSGSPLFDQNKRIVGQLEGGLANCSNDEYDVYGWFRKSWANGSSADTRLKEWLDPLGTNSMAIDGRWNSSCLFFGASPTSQSICEGDSAKINISIGNSFSSLVTLSVSDSTLPVNFSAQNLSAGDSSCLSIWAGDLALGENSFLIYAEDTFQSSEISAQITKVTSTLNMVSNLIPLTNAAIDSYGELEWDVVSGATQYILQISQDALFSSLIVDSIINANAYFFQLAPNTTYYWRVKAKNPCSESSTWAESHFTTNDLLCNTFSSSDTIFIDNQSASATQSVIEVLESGTILDVNVLNFKGNHSYLSDLKITLVSPQGTTCLLFEDICGSLSSDFNANFDAQSNQNISCPFNTGETYNTFESLQLFNQENLVGQWQLVIEDVFAQDGGEVTQWQIEICYKPDSTNSISSVKNKELSIYPNPTEDLLTISSSIDLSEISLYDVLGKELIHQKNKNSSHTTINIEFLPKGTYILKAFSKTNQMPYIGKVIKR